MSKIATITFHWAANYGAVMQAYSLQTYLKQQGYESEIINYVPRRIHRRMTVYSLLSRDFSELAKEKAIKPFRKNELKLSPKKYGSFRQLKKCAHDYHTIICGSDQIWNMGFTLKGEGGPALSYFLGFADDNTKRIAYAVSFGTDKVSDEYIGVTSGEVSKFHSVSVREKTGIDITAQLGKEACVVCDPTLLLKKQDYLELLGTREYNTPKVFSYILHKNQNTAYKASQIVKSFYNVQDNDSKKVLDEYEWLYSIAHSDMVVTNSFHGVMLSLIMNTPFVVVPVEGKSMNNRIYTILSAVGLENRIVENADADSVKALCQKEIQWENVNIKLDELRKIGQGFLLDSLK